MFGDCFTICSLCIHLRPEHTMNSSKKVSNLIAKIALLIGLPCGILLMIGGVLALLYYPITVALTHTEYDVYLLPITWGVVLTLAFIILIWKGGKKMKTYIEKEYSLLKSGFLYTLYISIRLFFIVLVLGAALVAVKNDWWTNADILPNLYIALSITVAFFSLSLFLVTFTIGIMTALAAKIIVTSANADLSLSDYAR